MKFTIETKAFQTTVKRLVKFAGQRSPIPMLRHLRVRAQDGTVLIEACDATAWAGTLLTADVDAEGEVLLDAMTLSRFAGACTGESVTILTDDKSARITSGGERFSLPHMDAEDWPTFTEQDWQVHSISLPMMRSALAYCLPTLADQKELRECLKAIRILGEGGKLKFYGTNTHILARAVLDFSADGFDVMIPRMCAEWILDVPDAGMLEISTQGTLAKFSDGKSYYMCSLVAGDHPNCERILAYALPEHSTAEREPLLDALRNANLLAPDMGRCMIKAEGSEITVASRNDFGAVFTSRSAFDGQGLAFCVSAPYLISALQSMVGDTARIHFQGPSKAVFLTEECREGWVFCTMPLEFREIEIAA